MSDVTVLTIDTIVSDPKVRGGRAIIAGTTLRVQDIAIGVVHKGYTVNDLLNYYPHLNPAQVYAALAYYYEHQGEIDQQIEEDERLFDHAKAVGLGQRHSPLF